jgi:ABC-type bacteriocin/lantibiotic exporter with double-glycine peptidase domain
MHPPDKLEYQYMKILGRFIKPRLPLFVQAILVTIAIDLLALSMPLFIMVLVDRIVVYKNIGLLNAAVIGIVVLILFKSIFELLKDYIMLINGLRISADISCRFYRCLQNLPFKFFEKMKLGDMQSRLIDIDIIQNSISSIIIFAVIDGLAVIIFIGVLLYLNWQLALFSFIFAPILILTIILFAAPLRKGAEKVMAARAEYMAFIYESLEGIRTIKALNLSHKFSRLTQIRLLSLNREEFKIGMLGSLSFSIGEVIRTSGGILILWFGARLVINGSLTLGSLFAFYALLDNLMGPLYNFTGFNKNLQMAMAATKRFYELYSVKSTIEDSPSAGRLPEQLEGSVKFKDVYFSYNGKDYILKGVNLNIPPKSITAIAGSSGVGKTTLCNLILRFYDPCSGSIFIDDNNIKEIKTNDLRQKVGLISQDPFLFSGTIKENILIAAKRGSAQDMIQAAKIADIHNFIMTLPKEYETKIGERGVNISGGQKQRIIIARTILQKPKILILDEATSSLDVKSETKIHQALFEMLGKITIIIITHRLSAIKNVDNIMVLDNGEILEAGRHKELISLQGIYHNLNRYERKGELSMPYISS